MEFKYTQTPVNYNKQGTTKFRNTKYFAQVKFIWVNRSVWSDWMGKMVYPSDNQNERINIPAWQNMGSVPIIPQEEQWDLVHRVNDISHANILIHVSTIMARRQISLHYISGTHSWWNTTATLVYRILHGSTMTG